MQSLYANCMVKSKVPEGGCLHVNVEEKWRVQMSPSFCFFFILYHSCKVIKIKWITYLRNILYHTKSVILLNEDNFTWTSSVQDLPVISKWHNLQSLNKALYFFIELIFL